MKPQARIWHATCFGLAADQDDLQALRVQVDKRLANLAQRTQPQRSTLVVDKAARPDLNHHPSHEVSLATRNEAKGKLLPAVSASGGSPDDASPSS